MLRKAYTPFSLFLEALALLGIGILFFTNPKSTLAFAISIIHILAWIAALNNLFMKADEDIMSNLRHIV